MPISPLIDRTLAAISPLDEEADLVTEMNVAKHPYESGIKAQPGIEF